MRQFSDSSAALRKPPPSANYHLVRFIWQLRATLCPASLCVTGRETWEWTAPRNLRENQLVQLSLYNGEQTNKASSSGRKSSRYVLKEMLVMVMEVQLSLKHLLFEARRDVERNSHLRQALLLFGPIFKPRAVIGRRKRE